MTQAAGRPRESNPFDEISPFEPPPLANPRRSWVLMVGLAAVVALVGVTGIQVTPSLWTRMGCHPGLLPAMDVWSQGGECVGISNGPYAFKQPGLDHVFKVLAQQNAAAADDCGGGVAPITVGVPMNLTSSNSVGRVQHELEAFVTTQKIANTDSTCLRPMLLRIGQMGSEEQASVEVVTRLADAGAVALVGMGLSDLNGAKAVNTVAARPKPVPMVADLITAEGFDATGSSADRPDFTECTGSADYEHGIGDGWFYRVSFRTAVQLQQLKDYLNGTAADFLVEPITRDDPSTCTQIPEYFHRFGKPQKLVFDPNDAQRTLEQVVNPICRRKGDIVVAYGARGRDAANFITAIDEQYQHGLCQADHIQVLMSSDGVRLRSEDPDSGRNAIRLKALRSTSLRSGQVRLLLTPLADRDVLPTMGLPSFVRFEKAFVDAGFDSGHLDDGWGVNAHDALNTVVEAVRKIPKNDPVTPSLLQAAVKNNFQDQELKNAIQTPLKFDHSGNRVGLPVLVRVCPLQGDAIRVSTVDASQDPPGTCPAG